MSNRMFLACRFHPTLQESLLLGDRDANGSYATVLTQQKMQKWLDQHATCGGGFDHFTVAYAAEKDNEAPVASPTQLAVHKALNS